MWDFSWRADCKFIGIFVCCNTLAWHDSSSLQPCGVSYGRGAEEGACIDACRHAEEAEEMQRCSQSAVTVSAPHHSCGSPCHANI